MTANELRIGNFVWEDYGGEYNVLMVSPNYVDLVKPFASVSGRYDLTSIEPIPLTEEWLLKFGFTGSINETSKCGNFYLGYDPEYYRHKMSLWYQDGSWFFSHTNRFTVLKYVHQLQNLYFALTGEELKIA